MKQTPSQTVGPFFAYGLTAEQYNYDFGQWVNGNMIDPLTTPNGITVVGKVLDGENNPIPDALVEFWQNDGKNKRFGRMGTGTDKQHRFIFNTTKPDSVEGQAPFISIIIFMRGQLIHSYTRMYFADEAAKNATDEVLNQIPESRRNTLLATKKGDFYEFTIKMQGENETVFFEI